MSSKTFFIYSTLPCAQQYTLYAKDQPNPTVNVVDKHVLIEGGHGVANKNIITPYGVMTEVTEEQMEILNNVPQFKSHKEAGYISVRDKQDDVEKVADNLDKDSKDMPKSKKDLNKDVKEEGDGEKGKK